MKKRWIAATAVAMSMAMAVPVFAAEWKQDDKGWWYQNDDGSYPVNAWKDINGVWYYFGADGYLLTNTITPDGCKVDANGAWIQETSAASSIEGKYTYGYQNLIISDVTSSGFHFVVDTVGEEGFATHEGNATFVDNQSTAITNFYGEKLHFQISTRQIILDGFFTTGTYTKVTNVNEAIKLESGNYLPNGLWEYNLDGVRDIIIVESNGNMFNIEYSRDLTSGRRYYIGDLNCEYNSTNRYNLESVSDTHYELEIMNPITINIYQNGFYYDQLNLEI